MTTAHRIHSHRMISFVSPTKHLTSSMRTPTLHDSWHCVHWCFVLQNPDGQTCKVFDGGTCLFPSAPHASKHQPPLLTVSKVLQLQDGKDCILIGTVFKDMKLRYNVLDEYIKVCVGVSWCGCFLVWAALYNTQCTFCMCITVYTPVGGVVLLINAYT